MAEMINPYIAGAPVIGARMFFGRVVALLARAWELARAGNFNQALRMRVGRRWTLGIMMTILLLGVSGSLLGCNRNSQPASSILLATITPTITSTLALTSTPTTPPTVTPTRTPLPTPTPDLRILNPANQHLYLYVKLMETWHGARDYCAMMGGHLVTIQSPSENKYVYDLATNNFLAGTWLGATDDAKEGTWVWVTGEPWYYKNWAIARRHPLIYEPDDKGAWGINGDGDFLMFVLNGEDNTWMDEAAMSPQYFVCEWEPASP